MMFSFLNKRSIFGSKSEKKPIDVSCLLTKYKNYCNDEYSTLDDSGMSVPPMACQFAKSHSKGHVLSVVDEDGYVVLYNVKKSGRDAVMKTWQVHSNAVFDVEWVHDDCQILTASGDQTVALWDIEKSCRLESFRGHSSSVRSVSQRVDDDAVFASGSRDGHIMIWDKRVVHKDGCIPFVDAIYNAHALQQSNTPGNARKKKLHSLQPKDGQQSVTGVLFQGGNYLVSAGCVDGCVKLWDMRKTHKLCTALPVHVLHYQGTSSRKHGYSSLTMDQSRCRLFASCTDDHVYEYNLMSSEDKPVHCFKGHKNSSFYVKTVVSPDNQFLLSGSSDHHAYIWQINKPEAPPVVLKAHDAEVTSVEWCNIDFTKIVTLSDDAKTKFWRIYSRDLKSNLHPQWFGRARRFSRDRSTSTVETSVKPTDVSKVSSSSTVSSPLGKLQMSSIQSSPLSSLHPTSKSPSVREWLKRKASTSFDQNGISEVSPNKSLCQRHGKETHTDECTSPIARPEIMQMRKRSFDPTSNRPSKELDSILSTCDDSHSIKVVDLAIDQLKSQSEETPTKNVRNDVVTEFEGSIPKSCFSPVKPNRSQTNSCENIHHPSPQKLKRGLNLEESSLSSPKRPCLTKLDTNGAFHRLSSARLSLFGNSGDGDNEVIEEFRECAVNSSGGKEKQCDGLPKPMMYEEAKNSNLTSAIPSNFVMSSDKSSCKPLKSPASLSSPTQNLPNLVRDQLLNLQPESPRLTSPVVNKKVDWLTQLRLNKIRKSGEDKLVPVKSPSPSPARRSPKVSPSVRNKKIPAYFTGQPNKGNE